MTRSFDYGEAFARTLGWVTELELRTLRQKRVAIAGVGGVGGVHLLTLTRLGIGAFNIADMDVFELANFNRQAGAMMLTLARSKVEVMAEMARDINPELDIRVFPDGVGPANFDDFLRDVDLYVDGLDFFVFDVRAGIFAACARLAIPAVTVAPLGMGAALLNFLPGGTTFEQYFGFAGATEKQKMLRFMVGLAPHPLHLRYLVDASRADMANRRGPSTPMACQICSGVAASEALKILLGRGKVLAAPHGVVFDAYLNRMVHTWRPGGYRNPLNRLMAAIAGPMLERMPAVRRPENMARGEGGVEAGAEAGGKAGEQAADALTRILEVARWAQSGDNMQPWRFERVADTELVVHFSGHRPMTDGVIDIYDYDGRPSLISLGCLVESMRLAASRLGLGMTWRYEAGNEGPKSDGPKSERPKGEKPQRDGRESGKSKGDGPESGKSKGDGPESEMSKTDAAPGDRLQVRFEADAAVAPDPLADFIELRSVDRRRYRLRALTGRQKRQLEQALGPEFSLRWSEGWKERLRAARLAALACHIRLGIAEAALVHQRVIDWDHAFSPDRIPALAIGSSAPSLRVMRWALQDPRRAIAIARMPGGTLSSQLEMELLPGMFSAGYFMLVRHRPPAPEDRDAATIRAGQAVQRFWLTASAQGLALQPCIAMLAFAHYGRHEVAFARARGAMADARRLANRFAEFCRDHRILPDDVVFMGRIGTPRSPMLRSRSVRKPLSELLVR